MAVTIVVDKSNLTLQGYRGDDIWCSGLITFDSSYPTGGESIAIADINTALTTAGYKGSATSLERMLIQSGNITTTPYIVTWDDGNSKAMAWSFGANTATAITTVDAEDPGTVSGHTTTLANIPIAVTAVDIDAGGATGVANLTTVAPATTLDCQVVLSTGVLNFLAADAVTDITCAYAYKTAGTAATLDEVANTTDLSSLTVEFYAILAL